MNDLFDAMQDAFVAETKETAEELEVDDAFASAIVYLRSRSRWTQELEDKLIQMCKNGESVPNMCDWP
jgi:SOS response regulatory protein OraA/RecX